ncbi:hypothetical protein D3C78_831200 [compost metagenome]
MLVGDVRCATTGFGCCWKLSGGRWFSSGVTKVSKKRQVCRAISRSSSLSVGNRALCQSSAGGRLL